jgi:hypothetical protein
MKYNRVEVKIAGAEICARIRSPDKTKFFAFYIFSWDNPNIQWLIEIRVCEINSKKDSMKHDQLEITRPAEMFSQSTRARCPQIQICVLGSKPKCFSGTRYASFVVFEMLASRVRIVKHKT